jgi:hypothetical protein
MNPVRVSDVESAVLAGSPRGPELGRGGGKSQVAGIYARPLAAGPQVVTAEHRSVEDSSAGWPRLATIS